MVKQYLMTAAIAAITIVVIYRVTAIGTPIVGYNNTYTPPAAQ